ncbi:MAG: nucleotide sugar dehydrogenase [bacterium]|nr:nucleotide sugar dehydrogenase [bacterium]
MKLCVIGLGYIGLPTAVMFANSGCDVIGVDKSEEVINILKNGGVHIEEDGLNEIVRNCFDSGRLKVSTKPVAADVYIIAVPTPNACDKCLSCDIRLVVAACKEILPYLSKSNIVIVESTVAPRTLQDYIMPIFEEQGYTIGEDLYLAHCPERVLPGRILYEMRYNNRIVGGITKECTKHAAKVYETFVEGKIIKTDAKTAEIAKCMENTYRDVNIALANELAKVCGELNIDCLEAIRIANEHPRVNILWPGPGVGGHCLAVDPYFIYSKIPNLAKLIKTARDINSTMPYYVVEKTVELVEGIQKPKIVAFGLTYKGNIDDTRESPAIKIIELLKADGFQLEVYDPHVGKGVEQSPYELVKDSDLVLILADHDEFKEIDYNKVGDLMRRAYIFDTRNIIDAEEYADVTVINYGNLFEFV